TGGELHQADHWSPSSPVRRRQRARTPSTHLQSSTASDPPCVGCIEGAILHRYGTARLAASQCYLTGGLMYDQCEWTIFHDPAVCWHTSVELHRFNTVSPPSGLRSSSRG